MAVFGIGVNDIGTSRGTSDKHCPYYSRWHSMVRRCYSEYSLDKHPYYKDVYVCDEWLTFSNFKAWMETQDWEGKELDKDLLGNGKLYSSETCCFIPKRINSFFTERKVSKGLWPTGVTYHKRDRKFYAKFSCPFEGREVHIGSYDNPEEAGQAYNKKRVETIIKMVEKEDQKTKQIVLNFMKERYK